MWLMMTIARRCRIGLDANFVKSSDFLGVSESSNRLRLWSGYFPAGRLVLGANAAVGSRGSQMMYVVLIQEGDFSDPAARRLYRRGRNDAKNTGIGQSAEQLSESVQSAYDHSF